MKPEEGCQLAEHHFGQLVMERKGNGVAPWRQCCRASGNPQHPDYYEPREPHLEADGFLRDHFLIVGKIRRRRQYERRQKGKRRKHRD
jgi:hypothetical protein